MVNKIEIKEFVMKDKGLIGYFTEEEAEKLTRLYAIDSMEQLISLSKEPEFLPAIAKALGIKHSDLVSVIEKAKQELGVIKHSGRKYPSGCFPSVKII